MKLTSLTALFGAIALCASSAWGQIAWEDFDGGAVNLISSSVPTLDGGGGDTFAVGALAAWPTTGGSPFSLADNSVGDVGDTSFFAGDTEGIYGTAADVNNRFLGLSDSDEFGADQTASWTFDISGYSDLSLSIGMGSMEGSTFAYGDVSSLVFTVSIDGGPTQTAFNVIADPAGDGFSYRPLDDGVVVVANTNALSVSGDNLVTKTLIDTGLVAADTFLDKSPASGTGAGLLDIFSTSINGTGSELTLTLVADLPFEAVVIDNIQINGVPEPSCFTLLSLGSLALLGLRRRS